jgi:hypothetical protein
MVEKPLTESVLTTLRLTVAPTAPRVTESELVEMRDTEPTITCCDTDTSKAAETPKVTLADVIRMLETVMLGSALSEIVPKAVVRAGTTKETVARRDTAPPAVSWPAVESVAVALRVVAPPIAPTVADRVAEGAIETAPNWPRNAPTVRTGTAVRVEAPAVVRMPSAVSPAVVTRDTAAAAPNVAGTVILWAVTRITAPPGRAAPEVSTLVMTRAVELAAPRVPVEVRDAVATRETAPDWLTAPATVRTGTAVRAEAPITTRMPSDVSVVEVLRDTTATAVREAATASVGVAWSVAVPTWLRTPSLVRVDALIRDTAPVVVSVVMAVVRDVLAERLIAPSLVLMPSAVSVVAETRETTPSVERVPEVIRAVVAERLTTPKASSLPAVVRAVVAERLTAPTFSIMPPEERLAVTVRDVAPV